MPDEPRKIVLGYRNLDDLIANPLQASYNDDLSDYDLNELTDDIDRNGLNTPIDITRGNLILDGHQRIRAARKLGWVKIRVRIRHDLDGASAEALERAFLEPNLHRRQYDPLAKVRVALRHYELRQGKKSSRSREGEVRELIGQILGISGRTVHRYLCILKSPVEVQNAVRAKQLKITLADKVANLKAATQTRIAERIRNGEKPKIVLAEYIKAPSKKHTKPSDAVAAFVRGLSRGLDDLGDRIDTLHPEMIVDSRDVLEHAAAVIGRLIDLCG